jgi:histidyl-tRNA synthetase
LNQKVVRKAEPISGFPEWLPEARIVELRWLDYIRSVFESYGFCSIETSSVEEVETLLAKGGDTDKEIYALRRLQETPIGSEPRVALHYDLTVPFARYVAQNYNSLVFPFKRYQMQRAWRGERPQEGRFREFYQCDIDIVDNETVSIAFDAELPLIVYEVLNGLGVGPFAIHINNRKILQGYYAALGVDDLPGALRIADRLDKVGPSGVEEAFVADLGLSRSVAAQCVALAGIKTTDESFEARIRELGVTSSLMDEGIAELRFVLSHLLELPQGSVYADLSIARGLDYYTGTVYEGKLLKYPTYPSICSGGRYENLVGTYLRRKLPGVGMSIGLTRIFAKLLKEGDLSLGAKCPTELLVAFPPGMARQEVRRIAEQYRRSGVKVEMYHEETKVQTQLRYAARKGIGYVLFPQPTGLHEVKDLASGAQTVAGESWLPPKGKTV